MTSSSLAPTIGYGVLKFPGATSESKATVERLLEEDRKRYHCFWGNFAGLHNHLSHHLLAAYDLGASPKMLQEIYEVGKRGLDPIHLADRKTKVVEEQHVTFTAQNWTKYLGQEKYYANFLAFFAEKVERLGVGDTLEQYVFSPAVNDNGANMLLRFIGGVIHPLIQAGYAVEFDSDAMIPQALAQAAVHPPFVPDVFDLRTQGQVAPTANAEQQHGRQPSRGSSLLEILREMYDSSVLHPVMPYDPNALLSQRSKDALKDGRPKEINRLIKLWHIDASRGEAELDEKVEELIWLSTLLLAGTGRLGRKPRLDFFLMHMVTGSLFMPSLLKAIPTVESKATLLRGMLLVILMHVLIRGRPRINPKLVMSYTATPRPPSGTGLALCKPDSSAVGSLANDDTVNPWPEIIASSLHHPDPHTMKTIRTLCYAAQRYGTTPPGGAIGAFRQGGRESHEGTAELDGTVFVRAAGVVMDMLGWVTHGQKPTDWDRSGLGWDDAWNGKD